LQSIVKYTDEKDYELIWIDTIPEGAEKLWWRGHYNDTAFMFDKRPDRVRLATSTTFKGDPGQYACYNVGAAFAKGDYLCFFQNDVFVGEGWLDGMKWYLDNKIADVVFPDQGARTRKFVKDSYKYKFDSTDALQARRDAGMLMMTRDAFDAVGGWDDRYKVHNGEGDMYLRIDQAGLKTVVTNKSMILHLEHAAGWERSVNDKDRYDQDAKVSSLLAQGKL
jgi:hypothetical protein